MSAKISRRRFLKYAPVGIGAAAVACGGLSALAFRRPVHFYNRKLAANRNPMNPIALVTYATRAGSTMEIAQAIALELENRGFTVDYSPIERVTGLEDYSHVVIGSAIRMSAPLPEVTQFIEEHRAAFRGIPLAFFAVHLSNDGDDEASRAARHAYLDPVRKLLRLQHEAFFTGVFDPKKVSFAEGLMGRLVQSPVGDFRDWAAIKSWGQSIFTNDTK
ncbi:MAG: twin-arginine translocation signal domain-containing protein [Chloroflexi bacterium]|nr:twin-arginine translocation signal domain-containing protein [Chloroflexota bacterium]